MRNKAILAFFIGLCCCFIYACNNASQIEQAKYMTNGKDLYKTNCQNCHGENGEGLGNLVPPLTDSIFLKTNKNALACIIKNGASKPIVVHGKTYQDKMPAFKELESIDIAQLITYITNSFGNKQGLYTYTQVAIDLKYCKPY